MPKVRLPLSRRNVDDMAHKRGIDGSHETVRFWWHLDEMFEIINGKMHHLWQAADHESEVLESFVAKMRDKKAALMFLGKAMRKAGPPEEIVTARLRSYGAAGKDFGAAAGHETGRWVKNRAENFHLPFRRRERAMLRFRRMRNLQKSAAVHAAVSNHSNQERSLSSRHHFKANRAAAPISRANPWISRSVSTSQAAACQAARVTRAVSSTGT